MLAKSCTSWKRWFIMVYPIIHRVQTIQGGAGFRNHPQYGWNYGWIETSLKPPEKFGSCQTKSCAVDQVGDPPGGVYVIQADNMGIQQNANQWPPNLYIERAMESKQDLKSMENNSTLILPWLRGWWNVYFKHQSTHFKCPAPMGLFTNSFLGLGWRPGRTRRLPPHSNPTSCSLSGTAHPHTRQVPSVDRDLPPSLRSDWKLTWNTSWCAKSSHSWIILDKSQLGYLGYKWLQTI